MRKGTIRSGAFFLAAALCFPAGGALAQSPYFQNKTIKIVRGGEPGGTGDLQSRALIPFLKSIFRAIRRLSSRICPAPLTGEEVGASIRELPRDPEIVGLYKKMADHGPLPPC